MNAGAGAHCLFERELRLRSVNEDLPVNGPPADLSRDEFLEDTHGTAAEWTEPGWLRVRATGHEGVWVRTALQQSSARDPETDHRPGLRNERADGTEDFGPRYGARPGSRFLISVYRNHQYSKKNNDPEYFHGIRPGQLPNCSRAHNRRFHPPTRLELQPLRSNQQVFLLFPFQMFLLKRWHVARSSNPDVYRG